MKNLNQLICDPQRIAAVTRTGLLDTGPEEAFDRLTRLAARSADAPVALVSLRDTHRHYFESAIGLPEPWAVFTVSLPRVTSNSDSLDTAAAPPETAADSPATQPNLRGLRILGVDDEADALDGLRLFFEQHQCEVRTASCANEAYHLLMSWRPDILISDVGMPGEDGFTLMRRLRATEMSQALSLTPAIALTAYARAEDRLQALSAGYQLHVSKPVDFDELLRAVATLTTSIDNSKAVAAAP